jgi:hypothetical protein
MVSRQQPSSPGRPTEANDRCRILGSRDMRPVREIEFRRYGCRHFADGHSHESKLTRVRLQIGTAVAHMVTPTGRAIQSILQIDDGRTVVVDAAANQVAFGGFLLRVFRRLSTGTSVIRYFRWTERGHDVLYSVAMIGQLTTTTTTTTMFNLSLI